MASFTENINLLKKDPILDGDDTFNIETMLNENWDKIDEKVGEIDDAMQNIEVPVTSVNNKIGDVTLTKTDIGLNNVDNIKQASHDDLTVHKIDYIQHNLYGTASGTNAKTIALTPAPTSYIEGMTVSFKNATENTGAVTININGLGAKNILKSNGNALSNGNLKVNSVYTIKYNGSAFFLQGEGGEYGTADPSDVIKGKTIGTDEGIKQGTLELTGNVSSNDVLAGKTYYSDNPKTKQAGTMPNRGSKNFKPSGTSQSAPSGYYSEIAVEPIEMLGTAGTTHVLAGYKYYASSYNLREGVMPNNGARNGTITTQGGQIAIPAGYTTGGAIKAQFANLTPHNIRDGVNVGGVVGSYKGFELPDTSNASEVSTIYNTGYMSVNTTSRVYALVWSSGNINYPGYYRISLSVKPDYRGYVRLKKNSSIIYTSSELRENASNIHIDVHCNVGDSFEVELQSSNGGTIYLRGVYFSINISDFIS